MDPQKKRIGDLLSAQRKLLMAQEPPPDAVIHCGHLSGSAVLSVLGTCLGDLRDKQAARSDVEATVKYLLDMVYSLPDGV